MSPAARHRAALRLETIARLTAHLAAHPPEAEHVMLFGSLARGDFDGASDADLLVLGHRLPDSAIHDAAGREVDMLLWSPAQWAQAVACDNPFVRTVREEGVELWRAPGLPPL
jgi:predicted nucleotidyltransferase